MKTKDGEREGERKKWNDQRTGEMECKLYTTKNHEMTCQIIQSKNDDWDVRFDLNESERPFWRVWKNNRPRDPDLRMNLMSLVSKKKKQKVLRKRKKKEPSVEKKIRWSIDAGGEKKRDGKARYVHCVSEVIQ